MKKLLASCAVMTFAFVGTAAAQPDDEMGGDDMGGDMGSDSSGGGGGDMSSDDSGGGGDDGGDSGLTMGIETTFPTGGNGAAADFLYAMGDNWLDLSVGINLNKGVDPVDPTMSSTTFGISLGVGYRMYKPMKGKIHPYIEPAAFLAISDFSAAGDTLALGVGGLMGVDMEVMPQFTLGTGIGASLTFADKFDTINFGLLTASIRAGFWW